jgi:hypothetical protein
VKLEQHEIDDITNAALDKIRTALRHAVQLTDDDVDRMSIAISLASYQFAFAARYIQQSMLIRTGIEPDWNMAIDSAIKYVAELAMKHPPPSATSH